MLGNKVNWPGIFLVAVFLSSTLAVTGIYSVQANEDPVVISLKDREMTLSEFNAYFEVAVRMLARQQGIPYGNQSQEQIDGLRRQYLTQLGTEMALLQEAMSRGIAVDEEVIDQQVTSFRDSLGEEDLADAGFTDESQLRKFLKEKQLIQNLTDVLTDEIMIPAGDVVTLHHDLQHELMLPEQVCIRHIVVENEQTAARILADLQSGSNFEDLARQSSTDDNTAEKGGDLGCFQKEGMGSRSEFERVAFNTGLGELGGPVESEFGYHVIKVYDHRPARVPTLDEAYEGLENDLKHEKLPEKLMEIRENSEIVTYPDRLDG